MSDIQRSEVPGPLDLNASEGRWLGAIRGPLRGGWFSFHLHGNPPFDTPVEVTFSSAPAPIKRARVFLGYRTREIDSLIGKEKWRVFGAPFEGLNITHWRPRPLRDPEPSFRQRFRDLFGF